MKTSHQFRIALIGASFALSLGACSTTPFAPASSSPPQAAANLVQPANVPVPGTWAGLGSAPLDPAAFLGGDMALAPNGAPLVAYTTGSYPDLNVVASRWSGSSWNATGPTVDSTFASTEVSLAVDASNRVYVSYVKLEPGSTQQLVVKRLERETWVGVGAPIALPFGIAGDSLHLRIDSRGRPVMSFVTVPETSTFVNIWRWNGSNWRALGTFAGAGDFGFDEDGHPVIAVGGGGLPGSEAITARVYDEGTWRTLGDPVAPALTPTQTNTPLGIASNAAGQLIAAYNSYSSPPSSLFVKRWTGERWVAVGGNLFEGREGGSEVALGVAPNGEPVVGFYSSTFGVFGADSRAFVKRFTNGAWRSLGDDLPDSRRAAVGTVLVDASNRVLVNYRFNPGVVTVQRFTKTPGTP